MQTLEKQKGSSEDNITYKDHILQPMLSLLKVLEHARSSLQTVAAVYHHEQRHF